MEKSDLTKCEMHKVVMQTAEPSSAREATERMVKTLDSTYAKACLKQVSNNATKLNDEEKIMLPSLLEDFEGFLNGNLVECDTEPVDLEINPYSRPFTSRYYPLPKINKETFLKDLKRLVEI